jgi:sulfonate transport system permease protein
VAVRAGRAATRDLGADVRPTPPDPFCKEIPVTAIDVLAPAQSNPTVVADQPSAPLVLVNPKSNRRRKPRVQVPRLLKRTIGPLLAIAIWQILCSTGFFDKETMASPVQVFKAGQELWGTGELQSNIAVSLERVVVGLAIGIAVGLTLAILSGLFRLGEDLLDPTLQIARAVPILGLVPMALIWFGVGETPKIFLIALGSAFPIYINTFAAIRAVDAKLVEAGKTFGLSRLGMVGRVILPGSVPGFLVGVRFALVGSWLIIIVAEQINAKSGIGYLINAAQTWGRTDIIMLGLAIYGALGLIADMLVRLLERRLLVWRSAFSGN